MRLNRNRQLDDQALTARGFENSSETAGIIILRNIG